MQAKPCSRPGRVRFAVGVHPHQAHMFATDPQAAAGLTAIGWTCCRGACAIGEIGLDYHYDFSPRDVQHAVFRAQLRLALSRGLPVVIHTREAEDDTLRILARRMAAGGCAACSTALLAIRCGRRALATGFHLSIPGIVTFPKADDAARGGGRSVPTTACWWRPTARIWRRSRIAASETSRPTSFRSLEQLAAVRGVDRDALGAAADRELRPRCSEPTCHTLSAPQWRVKLSTSEH